MSRNRDGRTAGENSGVRRGWIKGACGGQNSMVTSMSRMGEGRKVEGGESDGKGGKGGREWQHVSSR